MFLIFRFNVVFAMIFLFELNAGPADAAPVGCSPQSLTPDSTLAITLPWPHEGRLEIRGPEPEDAYYAVIVDGDPTRIGFRPILTGRQFKHLRMLSLRVRDIKGDNHDPFKVSKRKRNSTSVFTVSGPYRIYTVVLNYDEGFTIYKTKMLCEVNYVDPNYKGPRPKRHYYSDMEEIAE